MSWFKNKRFLKFQTNYATRLTTRMWIFYEVYMQRTGALECDDNLNMTAPPEYNVMKTVLPLKQYCHFNSLVVEIP